MFKKQMALLFALAALVACISSEPTNGLDNNYMIGTFPNNPFGDDEIQDVEILEDVFEEFHQFIDMASEIMEEIVDDLGEQAEEILNEDVDVPEEFMELLSNNLTNESSMLDLEGLFETSKEFEEPATMHPQCLECNQKLNQISDFLERIVNITVLLAQGHQIPFEIDNWQPYKDGLQSLANVCRQCSEAISVAY